MATRHLSDFISQAWAYVDPAQYVHGWHIDAIAEHLEAVNRGEILRLIINIPPRHMKSTIVAVMWLAWTWIQEKHQDYPLVGPGVQWFFASYAGRLAIRDHIKTRRLIASRWFQQNWGDRFGISYDVDNRERFDNTEGGYRIASSVGGQSTGEGGNVIVIDDAHKAGKEAESDVSRQAVIDWWDQEMTTRLNNPRTDAYVVIGQRVHEDDLCGHLLATNKWEHLMLPARFDDRRRCYIEATNFADPRTVEREALWPERFDVKELDALESDLGPYAAAAQLQQSPEPKGGGIFKREWWQLWGQELDEKNKELAARGLPLEPLWFPPFEYLVGSVDTALTEKQENDWSAMTVWGVFRERDQQKIMLVYAWQARLHIHELVERVAKTARLFGGCHRLLIEGKANGKSVLQELARLYADAPWVTEEVVPSGETGDKVARAYSVQNVFSKKLVHAPDRPYVDLVIDQMAGFPKKDHDDLVDSAVQALRHLWSTRIVISQEERLAEIATSLEHQAPLQPLYPS